MLNNLNIVKIGGNIINDSASLDSFLQSFSEMENPKILIHGGGKIATKLSKDLGIKTVMKEGRRITDKASLEVVTMVYAGLLNKAIVAKLQALNCNAIGLSGADANVLQATKRPPNPVDYGFVGDVTMVKSETIRNILKQQLTPVFCAISHDKKGQLLNINADTIASEVAISLSAYYKITLHYCFEKKGVLKKIDDENSIIEQINKATYKELLSKNIITDGMLPKMQNCFNALEKGVSKIVIGTDAIIKPQKTICTTITL